MFELQTIKKRIVSDIRFLKGWAKQPKSVGSIKPTSKPAADLMASLIPSDSDLPVLELGPGTGPITEAILESGISPKNLISVEFSADFCSHLRETYPAVHFIQGDAFNLSKTLAAHEGKKFSAILSGLPLLNFSKEKREKYIEDAIKWLAPGAPFIQLCYGPRPPVSSKPGVFRSYPTKWVLSNVPPARFWIYKDDSAKKS